METWVCRTCGRICMDRNEYTQHVTEHDLRNAEKRGARIGNCPACGGTGMKTPIIGQSYTCPACRGSGRTARW